MHHTRQLKELAASRSPAFEMRTYSRHLAALFHGSKLVTTAPNSYGKHAEIAALQHVRPQVKGYRLYVYRLHETNMLSRPCRACSQVLRRYPHVRVFYTDAEGKWLEDVALDNAYVCRSTRGGARKH